MSNLDLLIPTPRLLEVDHVELDATPDVVWDYLRTQDLADSPLVRLLFNLRTLPSKLVGSGDDRDAALRIDDLRSTSERPGFHLLAEDPGRSLAVGAIGKVWHLDIPFRHVSTVEGYQCFDEPDWVKVAWEIRLSPRGEAGTRLDFEVRVDATDDAAWNKFARYWKLIGPGSHFVRQSLLRGLSRRFGSPEAGQEGRALAGDRALPDAQVQTTHGITIGASPAAIWPWLLQMGCGRGGFYSIDALDNANRASAREIHPEWLDVHVGQVLPASPESDEGFEVLSIDRERALVLGGLFDTRAKQQLRFDAPRPEQYWHVTWAFALEPLGDHKTHLHVRARAAFSSSERLHLAFIRPVHALMQTAQLRNLARRAEGKMPRDSLRDVAEGVSGAVIMVVAAMSPFLRSARRHWGLSEAEANRPHAGDELVPDPSWSWTHAVELAADPEKVWPWVAQLGADRAGFYSYQWLENLAGCNLQNAETVHPEWQHQIGEHLVLHPTMPAIPIVGVEPGRALIAFGPIDEEARAAGRPWATASWAFLLEPLTPGKCRLISRFRTAYSGDLLSRLAQGPTLLEPIGFAMDRRMLLGIQERVRQAQERVRQAQERQPHGTH